MSYIDRLLAPTVRRAARGFPAVVLTGPRRAGKTTLLRQLFPGADYRLFEDPAVMAAVRADARGFLDELTPPVILDEIQNVPEILNFVRARIDAAPQRRGQWLLTGSQDFALMRGVTESMAGRAAVLQLWPLSTAESDRVSILRGGFPEVVTRPRNASLWFQSYLQTYLERDVRAISRLRDLATFRRFLTLVATRSGQLLNKTELAAPLGMSVPGISEWIAILEITGQLVLVPPYFENLGKRLIKAPKVYLTDSGLAAHLLGIETEADLARSPFRGALFEGFVASEIIKQQFALGRRRELYFFRDQRGLEVDFVVPVKNGRVALVEVKASKTVYPAAAKGMLSLAPAFREKPMAFVVHAGGGAIDSQPLAPGVRAVNVGGLLAALTTQSRGSPPPP